MATTTTPNSDVLPETLPLNEKEQAIYDETKKRLGDRASEVPTETMFIQFIRGYAYEEKWADKVVEMITKALDWRKAQNVNTICDTKLPKRDEFKATWTTVISGRDPLGHLIQVDRLGKIDPGSLLKKFTVEEVQAQHTVNQELRGKIVEEHLTMTGKRIYKMVSVLDLDGVGMGHLGGSFTGPARSTVDIDQWFYPESVHKLYIINTPWVFRAIWAIVKPWLHPITVSKIQICSSDFLSEMTKDGIQKDQLPDFLGKECTGTDMMGEFEAKYYAEAAARSSGATSSTSSATPAGEKKLKKKKKKKAAATEAAPAADDAEGSEGSVSASV